LQRTSRVRTAFNTVSASTITTLFVIVYCCFFYPVLEHGSPKHRQMCLDHIMSDLLDYATNEQGYKSVTKALKETGPETLDRIVKRMCEPAKGGRRAMIVDLALSVTGSQLIASTLPQVCSVAHAL
jgi:hypothetical protein